MSPAQRDWERSQTEAAALQIQAAEATAVPRRTLVEFHDDAAPLLSARQDSLRAVSEGVPRLTADNLDRFFTAQRTARTSSRQPSPWLSGAACSSSGRYGGSALVPCSVC